MCKSLSLPKKKTEYEFSWDWQLSFLKHVRESYISSLSFTGRTPDGVLGVVKRRKRGEISSDVVMTGVSLIYVGFSLLLLSPFPPFFCLHLHLLFPSSFLTFYSNYSGYLNYFTHS